MLFFEWKHTAPVVFYSLKTSLQLRLQGRPSTSRQNPPLHILCLFARPSALPNNTVLIIMLRCKCSCLYIVWFYKYIVISLSVTPFHLLLLDAWFILIIIFGWISNLVFLSLKGQFSIRSMSQFKSFFVVINLHLVSWLWAEKYQIDLEKKTLIL